MKLINALQNELNLCITENHPVELIRALNFVINHLNIKNNFHNSDDTETINKNFIDMREKIAFLYEKTERIKQQQRDIINRVDSLESDVSQIEEIDIDNISKEVCDNITNSATLSLDI